MNDRPTEELVRLAATTEDEDVQWDTIRVLHFRETPDVLDAVWKLCGGEEARERILGVDILAQSAAMKKYAPEQAVDILLRMIEQEQDAALLYSVAVASGHWLVPRLIKPLLSLRKHHDPDVRFGVVLSLLNREDERVIDALIELSRDENSHVRDWATFGLGSQIETDNDAIRDALVDRVDDPDDDTRAEALVGLARRADPRVVEPLLRELESQRDEVRQLTFEAAVEAGKQLGEQRLYGHLLRLRDCAESDWEVEELAQATARCDPLASARS